MDKSERVGILMAFMQQEGFLPELDKDGDIKFKFQGGNYYLIVLPDDELYVQLLYPAFWAIESEEERLRALEAAGQATAGTKVAKVYLEHGDTFAACEMFVSDVSHLCGVLMRCLAATQAAANSFREKMRGEG